MAVAVLLAASKQAKLRAFDIEESPEFQKCIFKTSKTKSFALAVPRLSLIFKTSKTKSLTVPTYHPRPTSKQAKLREPDQ